MELNTMKNIHYKTFNRFAVGGYLLPNPNAHLIPSGSRKNKREPGPPVSTFDPFGIRKKTHANEVRPSAHLIHSGSRKKHTRMRSARQHI